ncbi:MAG TPA: alpha/beta hydrolase [Sphingomonas sp.]|jgi:pimeloyl-ACP methyl ester carboxylesterase
MADDLLKPGWRSARRRVGDLELHVVEAGPEDGPPVVLLHGFPEFWWAWRHLLRPLADAGYRAIAPDMRGYGLSDAPTGVAAYRTDLLADDVAGLADALGLERFSLVGHDWGGIVAWAVASRHADRLDRLVIMDAPHADVWGRFAASHPTQALRSAYVGWFQLPMLPELSLGAFGHAGLKATLRATARPGVFTPDALRRYAEAWARPGRLTAMLNYYRALRLPGSAKLGRIATPTLILWGGRDGFLDDRLAAASAAMCDDARTVVLEDATHWLHLEEPARVAEEIVGFLSAAERS